MNRTDTTLTIEQPGMRFQARDEIVLQTIQDVGGVMAKRQLKALFWCDKSKRAMEKRLAKLKQNEYLDWPSLEQHRTNPIPEPVVWLDWKGAWYLAGRSGIRVEAMEKNNENKKRLFQKNLKKEGFSWLREPRWSQLLHDITVIDIRLTFQRLCTQSDQFSLEAWINETEFRSSMDVVDVLFKTGNGKEITRRKGICPDGMMVLADEKRRRLNQPFRARFLLEVDMATHDNPSFGWEKALAGAVYIKSKVYRERFGNNSGRWLIITTGNSRMKHLIKITEEETKGDANLFLFTTFQDFFSGNALQEKIWSKCGLNTKVTLFEE